MQRYVIMLSEALSFTSHVDKQMKVRVAPLQLEPRVLHVLDQLKGWCIQTFYNIKICKSLKKMVHESFQF